MKISKLNESVMKTVNKYNEDFEFRGFDDDDKDDKIVLTIYYYDADNERHEIKSSNRLSFVKGFIDKFIADSSNIDALDATALFVDDNEDRSVFSAFKDVDGKWDIAENNIDEYMSTIYMPDEFKDTLLNRIIYTLTSTAPPNLGYNSPSLKDGIIKIKDALKITRDTWGYKFDDDGNAIINITLNKDQVAFPQQNKEKNEKIIQDKKDMLKDVCEKFGVELKPFGERAFSIVVPDQMKYYTDVEQDA